MSGESNYARELVTKAFAEARTRVEMDPDALGRAVIQAVVEQYREYRSLDDVVRELNYLCDSLDDDDPVITRGC